MKTLQPCDCDWVATLQTKIKTPNDFWLNSTIPLIDQFRCGLPKKVNGTALIFVALKSTSRLGTLKLRIPAQPSWYKNTPLTPAGCFNFNITVGEGANLLNPVSWEGLLHVMLRRVQTESLARLTTQTLVGSLVFIAISLLAVIFGPLVVPQLPLEAITSTLVTTEVLLAVLVGCRIWYLNKSYKLYKDLV